MVESKRLRLIDSVSDETENPGLSPRAGLFESRIKRKLKEKDEKAAEESKAAVVRQQQILQTMTTIRKALSETVKIKLGERFRFDLQIGDWEGWPRLQLALVDLWIPEDYPLYLRVSAHDRHGLGTIMFGMNDAEVLGAVHLADPQELPRIPLVLKKAVRIFLDSVTSYVLSPKDPSEVVKRISLDDVTSDVDEVSHKLKDVGVFSDDLDRRSDNVLVADDEIKPIDTF